VVRAAVLTGALQGEQVTGFSDHAQQAPLAFGLPADVAQLLGRKVAAAAALTHLQPGCQQGFGKAAALLFRLTQQMQGQPLRGPMPGSRSNCSISRARGRV
jgi:hypothetical protein